MSSCAGWDAPEGPEGGRGAGGGGAGLTCRPGRGKPESWAESRVLDVPEPHRPAGLSGFGLVLFSSSGRLSRVNRF